METSYPIYSALTECHDCYKCIRQCPVKAIKMADGHARVVPELCIVCGHCVDCCPSGAKRVRDDLSLAREILQQKKTVLVSLAPSFVSEFSEYTPAQLIGALRALGFSGVSETALGAQQVSAHLAEMIDRSDPQLFISSACPVAVELVLKYLPEFSDQITPLLSPLLAHCRLLRKTYGEEIGIVFIGPCIAKKMEARAHPELLDLALTFEDLRRWLDEEGINPKFRQETAVNQFIPEKAQEGALYPMEGGMIEATRSHCHHQKHQFVSVSGVRTIEEALKTLASSNLKENLFLELLACEGGCLKGPKTRKNSEITARLQVQNYAQVPDEIDHRQPLVAIDEVFTGVSRLSTTYDENQLREVLLMIGKHSPDDELNCGGCGYDSCRELAAAILSKKAETSMCVSYMRQLAQKKANALLRTMPYGMVIVNKELDILESNERFSQMCGDEAVRLYEIEPGLAGASLPRLIPFTNLFKQVLETGEEIIRQNVHYQDRTLSVTIFSIEAHRIVGSILLDVTQMEAHREEIINKARLVIKNTVANAQEIAFLIGKNAAESECILESMIDGFSMAEPTDQEAEYSEYRTLHNSN